MFTIAVPPLRARKADILALADNFLEKYAVEHRTRAARISNTAIDMLTAYHWPGNVRELQNSIERAVIVCDGDAIRPEDLPPTLQTAEASGTLPDVSLVEAVASYERDLLMDALKTARGNRSRAATLFRTTERVVSNRVKKYGIDCRRFR